MLSRKYILKLDKHQVGGSIDTTSSDSSDLASSSSSQEYNTKTYLISGNIGLDIKEFRKLYNKNGWTEVFLEDTPKYVDYIHSTSEAIEIKSKQGTFRTYDPKIYNINSKLKFMLDKSHKVITNKVNLYFNMMDKCPKITKLHLPESRRLQDIKKLNKNEVIIIKPDSNFGGGHGIMIATNNQELEKAKEELTTNTKYKDIIAQTYIENPLLYKQTKMHLRMYYLVAVGSDIGYYSEIWIRGKILTAKLPYKYSDFSNKLIHDSHAHTTPKDLFFPEDFEYKSEINNILKQMKDIIKCIDDIYKPVCGIYKETKNGYNIFGLDFMVTQDYVVKLLEINSETGFAPVNDINEKYSEFSKDILSWIYSRVHKQIFI